ncbi:hypothetical protein HU200_014098 [Digitaria exilis]|uniref:Uncharacterized protein n=1 Tax=Digitaria exilis TaxID=1010633 RepID=A0A835FCQ0_9POAL|nr:hypothetical protein HU200_014098 [Digitaria exilis]
MGFGVYIAVLPKHLCTHCSCPGQNVSYLYAGVTRLRAQCASTSPSFRRARAHDRYDAAAHNEAVVAVARRRAPLRSGRRGCHRPAPRVRQPVLPSGRLLLRGSRAFSSATTGTFYDDPALSYTVDRPITGWDEKRAAWARAHPELISGATAERVLMAPRHAAAVQHGAAAAVDGQVLGQDTGDPGRHGGPPEVEWLWWVDSDAVLTDMDFALPLRRYRGHNLVVHGWPRLVFEEEANRSWTSLNAGVFLIRNCQWSLDFMDAWAAMGPDSPDYHRWGAVLKSTFKDKVFDESDDQSALVYLLLLQGGRPWREKVFLESGYYLEGYWVEIVGRLGNITERYEAMERRPGLAALRRRRAEVEHVVRAAARNEALARAGLEEAGVRGWRRPFVTHFTGCQPCSGHRNEDYSGDSCEEGMRRALNFADDQVLRAYGFRHAGPLSDDVQPLPFDYPAGASQ